MEIGTIFVWVMAAFYAIAGVAPLANQKKTGAQYEAWGYPAWFSFVTAVCEVAVAVLLLLPQAELQLAGIAFGVLIMVAAIITLIRKKEYSHTIPPIVVLVLTALLLLAV